MGRRGSSGGSVIDALQSDDCESLLSDDAEHCNWTVANLTIRR